jgi:DNA invertase Pin-like site-specific DNA recombinase
MTAAQIEARRKGGLATKARHGLEFYASLGRQYGSKGGRPKSQNLKQRLASMRKKNKRQENSLSGLKAAWRQRLIEMSVGL